ncbi:MAG: ParB/RepB/Spo0J family partition protein [Firmicutes bacterium]|nr:ParB/RepB/Spo0J family partition protein [Bacillota bacterium]
MRERFSRLLGKGGRIEMEPVEEIRVSEIHPSPYQPRKEFEEAELDELARSIERVGIIQPIVVRKIGPHFELVAGERRLKACVSLGMTKIPAIVRNLDDSRAAEICLIENLQRKDLNWLEEAKGYAMLLGEFGLTQEELATRIGKSQSAIANKLRLLRLPEIVQESIDWSRVSERHARSLLRLEGTAVQLAALRAIYEQDLTVKETEIMVDEWSQGISRGIETLVNTGTGKAGEEKEEKPSAPAAETKKRGEKRPPNISSILSQLQRRVQEIKKEGIDASWEEREKDGWREITLRFPKSSGKRKPPGKPKRGR